MKTVVLQKDIDERVVTLGKYIAETGATVRAAAERFGISKSTVHKDVTKRLKNLDFDLFVRVSETLSANRAERHIRGGMATKIKYLAKGKQKTERS